MKPSFSTSAWIFCARQSFSDASRRMSACSSWEIEAGRARSSRSTASRGRSPYGASAPLSRAERCRGPYPSRPDPGEDDPKGAIERSQSRLRPLVCVRGELRAQGQLDDRLLATASREGTDTRKDDRHVHEEDLDHAAILCEDAVEYQTDSDSQGGISSIVDRLIAGSEKFNYSGLDGY